MTRSLSRNLVKQFYTTEAEEKRVIDADGLLRHRESKEIVAVAAEEPDSDGFLSGLAAEEIDMPSGEDHAGNVVKAQEDIRALIEQAQSDAQAILEDARREASGIVESAKAQAESEKKNVLEQARKQGYEAGQAKADSELKEARRQFDEKARQLETEYQQQMNELEPKFIDTITSIYEHIFQVELGDRREILEHLISNTMHRLVGTHNFLIHVSKEDYPFINMQKTQILEGAVSAGDTVDVVEDMTLGKNECLIETDGGIFDCGVGTHMTELKRKLMLLAWSREG